MIIGEKDEIFKRYKYIYVENIVESMEIHKYIIIKSDFDNYFKIIKKLLNDSKNKTKKAYVDFYYANLNDIEKIKFLEHKYINNSFLEKFIFKKDEIYYNIEHIENNDKDIFETICKISFEEILFSTFYFEDITLWTSFKSEFIIFFKNYENIRLFIDKNCVNIIEENL